MLGYLRHSLLLRAGLAMGVVTVLAVASMASAVYIARSTHGEAAAVNLAGSLRMQCYRITAILEAGHRIGPDPASQVTQLTTEFQQRLERSSLTKVIINSNRKSLQQAYAQIKHQWRSSVLPMVQNYVDQISAPSTSDSLDETRRVFRILIANYVADIDHMVHLLEEDAESRIHMLGLIQGINLMLTLTVAIITLYFLHTDVINPLHDMLSSAERAGQGDFSVRVGHLGDDELGRLSQAFNTMTADLSKIYSELENRVAAKTEELSQSNRSLELLYHTSQHLTEAPVAEITYRKILNEIQRVVGGGGITLCLKDEESNCAYHTAPNESLPLMCETEDCSLCLSDEGTRQLESTELGKGVTILSVPVCDQEHDYGVLLIEPRPNHPLELWQVQMLETVGKHIGISVGVARRVIQRRRLALLDERSVIARELHDSLAQSLSYLKIQVTRLTILRERGANDQPVDEVLTELKEGLSAAYRQLRELLTTFRLQIDGCGLASMLSETVADFNARGEVEITLDNQIRGGVFSVNEEIHVLQIVREALSNVIHHSGATRARVRLNEGPSNQDILVTVEDNGIGIPTEAERTHHYGLAIMRERATSLNGDVKIERQADGGTRVCLNFIPNGNQSNKPQYQENPAS
ncbi:MAG: HAMP domain-containing protein [Candidatus Thiodiazotropha sp. (ex Dulcina madagascariensis)]|nr:HAMP domain-containing protein [Candidatus Thiodiazotropha sp. (ex Dulcina madagascariensis)]